MFQIEVNRKILFKDFETQLVVLETAPNELSESQETCPTRSAQKRKSTSGPKTERSRKTRRGIDALIKPLDISIEPLIRPDPVPSFSPLPAPLHTHLRVEGDHVEAWWNQVDGAAGYELWVSPQIFDVPEPPACCLYQGADRALIFPAVKINQPGFYHFQSRAIDAAGRPGAWSSNKTLPFHVPGLKPEFAPGLHLGELTIYWEPVECAAYYEIQMDQRVVYSSEAPSKCLENLPLGLHDFKVRPVFSGGMTEWENLPAFQTILERPLEVIPQEVSVFGNRDSYTLHWYCPADALVDSFMIIDPDDNRRVLGQLIAQASENSWFESFFKSRKAYRWPIPPALQIEGQRFAVQAVKGKLVGPLSEINPFPLARKPLPAKAPNHEVECSVGDVDLTLREFLRKKQMHEKIAEQKLEIYDGPAQLRQYSVYHRPVLQAMNLQPRTDYRLSLTLNNGQLWQVEIIFNPKTYSYNLTFQGIPG